jgi:hypothetical protein
MQANISTEKGAGEHHFEQLLIAPFVYSIKNKSLNVFSTGLK